MIRCPFTSPAVYAGLKRDSFSIKHLGGGVWDCSVQYTKFESDSQFTFDTGGGTQHISQSLQTVGAYPAPGEIAANFLGAIDDTKVDGSQEEIGVLQDFAAACLDGLLTNFGFSLLADSSQFLLGCGSIAIGPNLDSSRAQLIGDFDELKQVAMECRLATKNYDLGEPDE